MTRRRLHLVVPGPLDQRTGGYLYDARMVEELRRTGWTVEVHELEGRFPGGDDRARDALDESLGSLPDGATVLVDGLALGGLPEVAARHGARLDLLALVHHPLGEETGLRADERDRLLSLEADALGACRGVVVTSDYTATRVAGMGVPPDRIRAAPPGTSPAPVAPGPGGAAVPRLLSVASVTPRKGHDVLVEALGSLRDLPWTLDCVGSLERAPEHVRAVRTRVEEVGLETRIRWRGELGGEALEARYAKASLFVLASRYEGYGMALAEALVRGLPVVSTTGGAIPYTVPEDAGVLVPPGDANALADALAPLLDPDAGAARRGALARAARRHGSGLPDWPEAAAVLEEALLALTVGGR